MNESLIRRLSATDIAAAVSRNAFDRGRHYWRSKRVLSLDWDETPAGSSVSSNVRGSAWIPYDVEVFLDEGANGSLVIDGDCSCPIAHNCKHVAATLFAAIDAASKGGPAPLRPRGGQTAGSEAAQPALSSELSSWLDGLARVDEPNSEEYPPQIAERLIYVLDLRQYFAGPVRLAVAPMSTRILKDGSFSETARPYSPASALQAAPARFLRPSDRDILPRLARSVGTGLILLTGLDGSATLEAILTTGRARWRSIRGPAIRRGEPRSAELVWRLGDDAAQHLELHSSAAGSLVTVVLAPPWYIDEAAGSAGPLETGLDASLAEGLLAAPPVPAEQTSLLRAAIDARFAALTEFKPPELPPEEEVAGPPMPRLTLTAWNMHDVYRRAPVTPVPAGRLSFVYGPVAISEHDERSRPAFVREGRVVRLARDRFLEREALRLLRGAGFGRLSQFFPWGLNHGEHDDLTLPGFPDDRRWLDFLSRGVPALRQTGWDVRFEESFPIKLRSAEGPIEADLREGSGIDWFELDLGVMIDGERVDITSALLDLIRGPTFDHGRLGEPLEDDATIYLRLPDGSAIAVPADRLRNIVAALYELFSAGLVDSKDKKVRFSPFDAADLAEAEMTTSSDAVRWRGGESLRQLGQMLRAADGIPPVMAPAWFNATLRPYQSQGVNWLQFLRTAGLGAILADDMGLGKTVQTLAHLAIEKESGRLDRPALIISPTSVLHNWRDEAARFAPELRVLVLHGQSRTQRFDEIAAHDVVLTTYPLLTRDRQVLSSQEWHVVVLDEAQAVKNPDAVAAQAARGLSARQRLCLTGTPIENHLGELWAHFSFLSPGFLGDRQRFNRMWRRPIEAEGNEDRRRQLARRVRPFLLRRTKAEVANELPPKTEILEHVEMEGAQRDLYESIRLTMHERVRRAIAAQGLQRSHIILLDALLKLRQVCCDPRLLKLETAKAARARSAKFERLMEMLPELLDEGRRILLFSQFTSMLALIEEALDESRIPYALLTGDTRDREAPVRLFQSGDVPLFLISLKAGGVGLNLTAADTVIHYDPWWNPAVEEQATDRAHRIGQEKPVFVYRLVARASIEEKMEALKARKRELAAGLFDPDGGSALNLSEADVEELFAPL